MTTQDFISLTLDFSKTKNRRTSETYESLKGRGYKQVSELAGINTPSQYYYSPSENRLFSVTMAGVSEIIKAETRMKKNQSYSTIFSK